VQPALVAMNFGGLVMHQECSGQQAQKRAIRRVEDDRRMQIA
jgi:hypothetical protein